MVERKGNQDAVHFFLPRSEYGLNQQAIETVTKLVTHPNQIGEFLNLVKDNLFLAEANGDSYTKTILEKYLGSVANNVETYKWRKRHKDKFTTKFAEKLMSFLPEADKKRSSPVESNLDRIAVGIARGFLESRFENTHDWRGQIETKYQFFSATVHNEIASGMFQKYHDLITGKYPKLMAVKSHGWISNFVATRAVDPKDEKYLAMADQSVRGWTLIAELIGKDNEIDKYSDTYAELAVQYDSLIALYHLGGNINNPQGKEDYFNLLEINVLHSNKEENFYGQKLDFEILKNKTIPPEVLEVAAMHSSYPERGIALTKMYESISDEELVENFQKFKNVRPEIFPFTVVGKSSAESDILLKLFGEATMRKKMEAIAQDAQKKNEKWVITPFAIEELSGYIVGNPTTTGIEVGATPETRIREIKNFLHEQDIAKLRDDRKRQSAIVNTLYGKDFEILTIPTEYSAKTIEECALDLHVPNTLRTHSLQIFGEVVKDRLSIPREFTQLPTRSGYLFNLVDHPDLPGVFNEVLVNLDNIEGIAVRLQLSVKDIALSQQSLKSIEAKVTFPSNRTKIELNEIGNKLPLDLQWITELTVLSLVRSVTCIPLNETEEPHLDVFVPESGEHLGKISIPGRIGHVGGYRHSGERKQFTQLAEIKFQNAIKNIRMATGGLSLAQINLEHKKLVPECKRSLTWYSGYEPEMPPLPVVRKSPKRLISIDL